MNAAPSVFTREERRLRDREAAIFSLVAEQVWQVGQAGLSPRLEIELRQAGADRLRHVLEQLDAAVLAAVNLDRQEGIADRHAQTCRSCVRWRVVRFGICPPFKRIRRVWGRLAYLYGRALKRLEAA